MLTREITIEPAWDRRDPDPRKNYGIAAATLRMVVKGDAGAVQFVLYTGWYLPEVQKELQAKGAHTDALPVDLGYHSKHPMYEGHEPMGAAKWDFDQMEDSGFGDLKLPKRVETGKFDPCPYVGGGPCYYDGSGLQAQGVYEILLTKGSEAVWEFLEKYYQETFKNAETSNYAS